MNKNTALIIGSVLILLLTTLAAKYYALSSSAGAAPQDNPSDCKRPPQDYNCDGKLDIADYNLFVEDFRKGLARMNVFELIRQKMFADTTPLSPTTTSGQQQPSPQPTPTPQLEKVTETGIDVLVLTIDPVFSDTSKTVRGTYGYIDPLKTFQGVRDILAPYLPVRIAEQEIYNEFPPIVGYSPQDVERLVKACLADIKGENPSCLSSWALDYNKLFEELDICSKVNTGRIDEIWLGTYPYNGSGEGDMVGPNPYNINGRTIISTECKKNVPILSADYAAPGAGASQSLDYSLAITLHSLGHRIENTLALVHGGWHDQPVNNWDHFAYAYSRYAASGNNTPPFGCGNIHYPPNAQADYEYSESRNTQSYCDTFRQFPSIQFPAAAQSVNCNTWSCTQLGFMQWWYQHLPKASGESGEGVLHNWYEYVFNPERVNATREGRSDRQTLSPTTLSPTTYDPIDYVEHYYDSLR